HLVRPVAPEVRLRGRDAGRPEGDLVGARRRPSGGGRPAAGGGRVGPHHDRGPGQGGGRPQGDDDPGPRGPRVPARLRSAAAMPLTRRQFLLGGLGAGAAGAAGLVVARKPWDTGAGGHPSAAAGGAAAAKPGPGGAAGGTGKDGILVLLTLYGGNDGLNTLIPYQDGAYLGGRSQLGYQPNEVIPLDQGLALHPNLSGLKGLWDAQQLAIVRGVGYPNPNRSHFRSMDIWQSGAPDANVSTGWIGRWLDATGGNGANDPLRAVSV